jgi:2'-hydroxyisoflavone reductase
MAACARNCEVSRLLVIGGTGFVGPHLSRAALSAGHDLTLFHRGDHPVPEDIVGVREIHGDRLDPTALARAAEEHWDAVIDTSCYVPRAARLAVDALGRPTDRYVLISTVSVYPSDSPPYVPETGRLERLVDATTEEVTGETYGGLKALCEDEVISRLSDRAVVIRPSIVVGPGDRTDRFTYWCRRLASGGDVLAPGPRDLQVQYIDVRDLTSWILHMATHEAGGVYNAAGPAEPLTMGAMLDGVRDATGGSAVLEWVSPDFLLGEGVEPWSGLPLWVPVSVRHITADISKAVAAGLLNRPLADTVRDTIAWAADRPMPGIDGPPGLSPDQEKELLARWRARPDYS